MTDAENSMASRALAKLSAEDRERALQDLIIFGSFYIYERRDGTAELLDPVQLVIANSVDKVKS